METSRRPPYEQFTRIGMAAASSRRLKLLEALAQGERTVEALARNGAVGRERLGPISGSSVRRA